jgi:hypothetical protein
MCKTSTQGKYAGQPAIGTICLLSFPKTGISILRIAGGSKYTPGGYVAEVQGVCWRKTILVSSPGATLLVESVLE